MAKLNSKYRYMYDADPSVALIAKDHAAKTASFNGTAIALDKVLGHWNAGSVELADQAFPVVINVEAIDKTTGDETYVIELEFGPAGFASSVKTGKVTVTGAGQYVILVDIPTLQAMKATGDSVRLAATLAGTTPSIALHAFIGGAILR